MTIVAQHPCTLIARTLTYDVWQVAVTAVATASTGVDGTSGVLGGAGLCDKEAQAVLPHGLAHRAALRELPGCRAAEWYAVLDTLVRERQRVLTQRLDAFGVSADLRDVSNVLCGVRKVHYAKPAGAGTAWGWLFDGVSAASCSDALHQLLLSESTSMAEAQVVRACVFARAITAATSSLPHSHPLLSCQHHSWRQPAHGSNSARTRVTGVLYHIARSVAVRQVRMADALLQPTARHLALTVAADCSAAQGSLVSDSAGDQSDSQVAPQVASERTRAQRVQPMSRHKRPTSTQLDSYLHFFGAGSEELDALHAALSDAVLDIYVEWHLPGGRLESECPPGWTRDDLRARKNADFRLPFPILSWVARFAFNHADLMSSDDGPVAVSQPGGAHESGHGNGRIAASYLKKAMVVLREAQESLAREPQVVMAYAHALRELGQVSALKALPLLNEYQNAILRQCDLREKADVRTVTWTVVAPLLIQRTCEGISQLHADLVIEPRQPRGEWRVPGWTKTADGIEGCVNLWGHRSCCRLIAHTLHEAIELPRDELRAAACSPGEDGKLSMDAACPVCLVWLSRVEQGHGASPRDGLHPLYQELDGSNEFNGRVVDPDILLRDLRTKMDAADKELHDAGKPLMPKEGRVLYMARHGGIMQLLMKGYSLEWVAERARIPVSTLLRFYRAHNVSDEPFETNGSFGNTRMALVCAQARSEGWLCNARTVENLLKLCELSLSQAAELPRPQLYARIVPLLARDAGLTSAAAALLRNANV